MLAITSACLTGVGAWRFFLGDAAAGGTATGIGFLFTVLLLLSKFKRFKGFGFEAEMWAQEQEQAGNLIKQLQSISVPLVEQLSVFAATIGLDPSGLTIEQKRRLLEQLDKLACASSMSLSEKRKALSPLFRRLAYDCCWRVDHHCQEAYKNVIRECANIDRTTSQVVEAENALAELGDAKNNIKGDFPSYFQSVTLILSTRSKMPPAKLRTLAKINDTCSQWVADLTKKAGGRLTDAYTD